MLMYMPVAARAGIADLFKREERRMQERGRQAGRQAHCTLARSLPTIFSVYGHNGKCAFTVPARPTERQKRRRERERESERRVMQREIYIVVL